MGKRHSKLRKHDLLEIEQRTSFSKKEIQKWYKGFLNDCPNGRLTFDGFRNIYQQFFPLGNPTEFTKIVFDAFDENNDGYIEFKEFISALSVTTRGTLEEKLKWSFELYDLDHDGQITRAEMLQITNAIYHMVGVQKGVVLDDESTPEKRVDKIFATMDINHDGVLRWDEFRDGCRRDPSILRALGIDVKEGVR